LLIFSPYFCVTTGIQDLSCVTLLQDKSCTPSALAQDKSCTPSLKKIIGRLGTNLTPQGQSFVVALSRYGISNI